MKKYLITLMIAMSLCGCVKVRTPHSIGDKVYLNCDVYLVNTKRSTLPTIDINNERNVILPSEVSEENVGKTFLEHMTITGVLRKGTELEVKQFALKWAGGYTYHDVFLKNIKTKALYDLSNSNSSLIYSRSVDKNELEFFLSPKVFNTQNDIKK